MPTTLRLTTLILTVRADARMSHSAMEPNVKLTVRKKRPIWISLRYIGAGEELLWTYSRDVPASWYDESRATSSKRACEGSHV